jgi:hypothetical protein
MPPLILQYSGNGTDAVEPVAGIFHIFTIAKSQAEAVLVQLDLADKALQFAADKLIPQSEVLQVRLNFFLI